ncbi:MAG: DinB family protein [Chitinophagaceae bacterium]|nr:DinB family protein [Chitinophagaceae bacterium]
MIHLIDNIRKTRTYVLNSVKDLSLEKLNIIPHGFNNNIFWNIGHLVASQQAICYIRPGLKPALPEETFKKFAAGTKPEAFFQSDEEDEIKKLLFSALDQLERDFQQNAFKDFSPWTTRTGLEMANINDALVYMHFHEGLHTGVISAMKKLVQK